MPVASPDSASAPPRRGGLTRGPWPKWAPLVVVTGLTLGLLLWVSGFFSLGRYIPQTIDINPAMIELLRFHYPPQGYFFTEYWLGQTSHAVSLQPLSLLAWLPTWMFFSGVYPLAAALALPAAYLFLRELQFTRAVRLLAALFYAWQGEVFSTVLAGHFPAPIMWALLPLSAWLVLLSARRDDAFLAAAAGVAIGLQVALLPDRGMLCSLLLASFFLVEAWLHWREGIGRMLRLVARLGLVIFLAGLIALPDLRATLQTLVFEVESQSEIVEFAPEDNSRSYAWATQWSWAPEEAAAYLVPGIFGWFQDSESGPYWGRVGRSEGYEKTGKGLRNHRLASFTWGTLAVPLCLLGLLRFFGQWRGLTALSARTRAYLTLLLVTGAVGYILPMGKYTPVFAWFYELPGQDTWRNPLKFLMPVSLSFLVLIAAGADFLRRALDADASTKARLVVLRLLQGLAAILVVVWLWAVVGDASLFKSLGDQKYVFEQMAAMHRTMILSSFVALGTMALAALACWWLLRSSAHPKLARWCVNPTVRRTVLASVQPGRKGTALLAVLGALNLAQMLWVHSHYVNLIELAEFEEKGPMVELLQPKENDRPRVALMRGDPVLESLLQQNFRYHGVETIDIPAASRVPNDYRAWFHALGGNKVRQLELSSVRYFVLPTGMLNPLLKEAEFAERAKRLELFPLGQPMPDGRASHAVLELKNEVPRAVLLPQLDVMPTKRSVLSELSNPEWDPHTSLLVDGPTARAAGLLEAAPERVARDAEFPLPEIVSYDRQRVELKTEAPQPAYLLLTDRFDPAWRATVNGQPATIFPANFMQRGIKVPAGEADVVLTFHPPVNAVYLQLVTWGCFLAAGVFWLLRNRGGSPLLPPPDPKEAAAS